MRVVECDSAFPQLLPDESILGKMNSVSLFTGRKEVGSGMMACTSGRLLWQADGIVESMYVVEFEHIGMHAIMRDAEHFPLPCIYCQVEKTEMPDADEEEEGVEEQFEAFEELYLVPSHPQEVDMLFEWFSECATLTAGLVEGEEDDPASDMFFSLLTDPQDQAHDNSNYEDADEEESME